MLPQNDDLGTRSLLLDSSLIIATILKKYNYKVVSCGDYFQVYYYPKMNMRNAIKNLDIDDLKKEKKVALRHTFKELFDDDSSNNLVSKKDLALDTSKDMHFEILDKNIIRTKLSLQRIAKTNAKYWTSFITLTYEENFTDIQASKKHLHNFFRQVTRVKPDFRYLCIIEFQKRGAIHYHLLTNLSTQDNNIIVPQKSNNKFYDVKYWNYGFTGYEEVTGDMRKIVGYISKYMSKECDNRLFGIRRYSYSRNLDKPIIEYLDTTDSRHLEYLKSLLANKTVIYTNTYLDKNDEEVFFQELQTL